MRHISRSRRGLALPAIAIGVAAALAGCSGSTGATSDSATSAAAAASSAAAPSASAAGSAAAETKPSGSVSIWLDDNAVNPCFVKTVTSTYDNPNVELTIELKKDWDKLTKTAVAGGAGPDIIMTPGPSYTAEYAKAGALAPLDAYVGTYAWNDKFAPWALKLGMKDGQLYSLPSELETMVLWYNKTVMDAQGVAIPKTTAELVAAADKLQAAGIIPFGGGNAEWKGANEWYVSALLNAVAGPDAVYQALTGATKFTDPGFVEAITTLNDFQQKGQIAGGLDRYYTKKFDEFLAEFAAGKNAMDIEGSWRFENIDKFFTEAGNEWDWAPFPTKDGTEQYAIGVGSSWGINAKSASPDAAADVLAHIFDPATQAKLAVDCGMAPGPVNLDATMLTGLEPRKARLYEAISKAANAGDYGYLTWTFWPTKSDQYIIDEVEKVWGGSMTPQEYLAGLDEIYTKELAAGGTPPIPER